MPGYYDSDNLDCWVLGALTEQYEWQDDDECREKFFKILAEDNMPALEDEVENILESTLSNEILLRALMNTIDFSGLMTNLQKWAEDWCQKCYEQHGQEAHTCTKN